MANGSGITGDQIQERTITIDNLSSSLLDAVLQVANNLSDVADSATSNQNLFSNSAIVPIFVSNVTTLDATFFGANIALQNGGPAATVNLPVAATFSLLHLYNINGVAKGVMQLVPNGSETINGVSSLTLGVGDSVLLIGSMGSGWSLAENNFAPAYCNVSQSAPQDIPPHFETIVTFDTINIDINGFFDSSVTHSYTPLLPGVYQLSSTVVFDTTGAGGVAVAAVTINVNGASIAASVAQNLLVATQTTLTANAFVRLNGSTDVVTVTVSQDSATDPDLNVIGENFIAIRMGIL